MVSIKISESKIKKIQEICKKFNNDEGELINILHTVQSEFGYLPAEVQEIIAKELKISVAKIYGIVTFYSFFTMTPKGEHPISVCLGTACYVRGAEKVLDEFKKQLNIKIGESTSDGKFSINCLRCVGACGLAPVVMIGDKTYGRVAPEQVKEILEEYK
ncbi:MAG TPA: NADH-quinone oxidoreductase subunit NuoE [Bacteroidales bacterium]|jgi:NADH-quinone oxidoreductase subunit E/NADP-reducing hydrogenase subunit HndA|nr:NADH-quinone oxidoreductase subunit NuoE [Bacteroidales bacterium]